MIGLKNMKMEGEKVFNEVHFEIQNKCLLNCKHCSSKKIRMGYSCKYGLKEMKSIIDTINGPIHIFFTGGEPLIEDSILNYIRELKKYRESIEIGVFTCGLINSDEGVKSISQEKAIYYKSVGLSNCYISIYDLEEKMHSKITNMKDSLKYTLDTIKNFISVGIIVKIHLVLNKYNIGKIEELIKELEELGVEEIRILRLVKSGSAIDHWDEIGVDYKQQNNVIKNIINNINKYNVKLTISGFPDEVPCRPFDGAYKCQGGTNVLYVELNGDIYPCACTKSDERFRIGHISQIDLIEKYKRSCSKYNDLCLNPLK